MILNRFAPLSVRSNPRSLLVGRRVGRFVASLEKCSATKFRCWAVPRPLPGPPGGQAPARAPGGAGFKGQRPLRTDNLHSASLRTPLTSRVIRALAECERAGSGPVQNELWVWLSIYGPRGDPQIPMLPGPLLSSLSSHLRRLLLA